VTTVDSAVRKKNAWYVVNGQQEILPCFVTAVDLEAIVKNAVFVMVGLLEIQQWFAMNTKENVLNAEVMFRQLHLTHSIKGLPFDLYPNFCSAKTSFMLGTSGDICLHMVVIIAKGR